MEAKRKVSTVDEYLKQLPIDQVEFLEKVRMAIKDAAPEAEEILTYSTPGYKLNGMLVGFAAAKTHCGFYVMSEKVVKDHKEDLSDFDTAKTTVRFSMTEPVPVTLIKKLVKARVKENTSLK